MGTRQFVLCIQVTNALYSGHTVEVNGDEVAFRKYDGSDTAEVEQEIGQAFGAMLLKQLREDHPAQWHETQEHSEDHWD